MESMPRVREQTYAGTSLHGRHRLEDLASVRPDSFSLLCRDQELNYLDLRRSVFLDTETTGLGMGAGTYVFLVGVGYLEGDRFCVKQYFLRGPDDERDFLTELSTFLKEFQTLITFNGKAFDWPLLETRFLLQRMRPPFEDPPHIDLLHPARRLWKRRLPSCSLSSLEAHILGVERTGEDVPGYLIPQIYFQYQATGNSHLLNGVFYHNGQDILSLAGLAIHMHALVQQPLSGMVRHSSDYLALAKMYDRAGEVHMAASCYEEALRTDPIGAVKQESLIGLALLYKRARNWDSVVHLWHQLLDDGGSGALFARVELAKYYEHVERDYLTAIDHVQFALGLCELYELSWIEASRRDLEHRLSRLINRSIRSRSWVESR